MGDLLDISADRAAVGTNDAHYTFREEHSTRRPSVCATGSLRSETARLRFGDFYVKSAAEMRAIFPDDDFQACDSTLWNREGRDNSSWAILLPHFRCRKAYLRKLVKRRPSATAPAGPEVWDRIEHELKIIEEMGFPATSSSSGTDPPRPGERDPLGPGRGSAAIHRLLLPPDHRHRPLEYGLIFEILNPIPSRYPTSTWTSTSGTRQGVT